MRMSKLLAPTLREDPKEAEVISHKLMLRAGYIRKLAAGIYEFLPLGIRVVLKISQIVREEMNRAGAQELFFPVILPAELWKQTGRWDIYGDELFRIKDRHDRDFCLGPTHEEIVTTLVKNEIKSYKQLPINLYQIQTKFRDEIRPRFGVMRAREFLMKDAYSFHASEADLDLEYKNMYETYCRIFNRLGLKYRVVEADPGAIGGGFSQEFMVLADSGEEEIFYCDKCNYAASKDGAAIKILNPKSEILNNVPNSKFEEIHTPEQKTIEQVASFLKAKPEQMIKTMIYEAGDSAVAVLVRGDHAINEAKVKKFLGAQNLALASEEVIKKVTGAPVGFAGPVGLSGVRIIADQAVAAIESGVTGANKKDYHLKNVVFGRDYEAELSDLRYAAEGDDCPRCQGGKFGVCRGIEVGHIFKLGTKYSKALEATYLDENNQAQNFIMGCYGIGVSRIAAAAIEQNNDDFGIIWPIPMAPYQVAVIPVRIDDEKQESAALKIYEELQGVGIDVILDDRDASLGVRLKDIDLMGFPVKIIIGPKSLQENKVEVKMRTEKVAALVPVSEILSYIQKILK
ncbi:MAG: proline--tRNA ligase [Candidatus Saganbacteria bacterium]|nr:proline--tRNA ligase [Candidatus Saganbacteria bacterium]